MLRLTNRKTKETYSYKYILKINNKKMEILSNFNEGTFNKVIKELSNQWDEIKTYKILDCIEFNYTDANDGIYLDTLRNYL